MTGKAKWKPLLGDDLARRVARLGVDDPAEWCRQAVAAAVGRAEAEREARRVSASAAKAQADCPHPEKDRIHQRCGRCGLRGLPVVEKAAAPAAAGPTRGGRR